MLLFEDAAMLRPHGKNIFQITAANRAGRVWGRKGQLTNTALAGGVLSAWLMASPAHAQAVDNSLALPTGAATASGNYATALGYAANASGENATAVGSSSLSDLSTARIFVLESAR